MSYSFEGEACRILWNMNHYKILGLHEDASGNDIMDAFERLYTKYKRVP